jgi:hypothetical protein
MYLEKQKNNNKVFLIMFVYLKKYCVIYPKIYSRYLKNYYYYYFGVFNNVDLY